MFKYLFAIFLLIPSTSFGFYLPYILSSNVSKYRIFSAVIAGGCASITSQTGSWLSSVSSGGTGQCALVIASGIFSAAPVCSVIASGTSVSAGEIALSYYTNTTTGFSFFMSQPGVGAQNRQAMVICMGPS